MRLSGVEAGVAALSELGIRRLLLPDEARRVRIYADHDEAGQGLSAAREAARRWKAEGRDSRRVDLAHPRPRRQRHLDGETEVKATSTTGRRQGAKAARKKTTNAPRPRNQSAPRPRRRPRPIPISSRTSLTSTSLTSLTSSTTLIRWPTSSSGQRKNQARHSRPRSWRRISELKKRDKSRFREHCVRN